MRQRKHISRVHDVGGFFGPMREFFRAFIAAVQNHASAPSGSGQNARHGAGDTRPQGTTVKSPGPTGTPTNDSLCVNCMYPLWELTSRDESPTPLPCPIYGLCDVLGHSKVWSDNWHWYCALCPASGYVPEGAFGSDAMPFQP